MSDEPKVFFAPPEDAKQMLEALTGDEVNLEDYEDDDEVSGFSFRPLMPKLGGTESPLRPLNAQSGQGDVSVNASMWPIPVKK